MSLKKNLTNKNWYFFNRWNDLFIYFYVIQAVWGKDNPFLWEAENAQWYYGCSDPSRSFPCKSP